MQAKNLSKSKNLLPHGQNIVRQLQKCQIVQLHEEMYSFRLSYERYLKTSKL